jgi:Cd2+/Zn2+-exporting ATPase
MEGQPVTSQQQIEFRISGMDCASCARTLEGSIAQLDGVDAVQINFATARMAAIGAADLRRFATGSSLLVTASAT